MRWPENHPGHSSEQVIGLDEGRWGSEHGLSTAPCLLHWRAIHPLIECGWSIAPCHRAPREMGHRLSTAPHHYLHHVMRHVWNKSVPRLRLIRSVGWNGPVLLLCSPISCNSLQLQQSAGADTLLGYDEDGSYDGVIRNDEFPKGFSVSSLEPDEDELLVSLPPPELSPCPESWSVNEVSFGFKNARVMPCQLWKDGRVSLPQGDFRYQDNVRSRKWSRSHSRSTSRMDVFSRRTKKFRRSRRERRSILSRERLSDKDGSDVMVPPSCTVFIGMPFGPRKGRLTR